MTRKALSDEYSEQIVYFSDQIEKIREFNCDTLLYAYVNTEFDERKTFYKRKLESLTSADVSAEKSFSEYDFLIKEKESCEKDKQSYEVEIVKTESEINNLKTLIKLNEESLNVSRKEYNDLSEKLSKILENSEDFDKEFVLVCDKLKFLNEKTESITNEYKTTNEKLLKAINEAKEKESDFAIKEKLRSEAEKKFWIQ